MPLIHSRPQRETTHSWTCTSSRHDAIDMSYQCLTRGLECSEGTGGVHTGVHTWRVSTRVAMERLESSSGPCRHACVGDHEGRGLLPKLNVVGSSPISRSSKSRLRGGFVGFGTELRLFLPITHHQVTGADFLGDPL